MPTSTDILLIHATPAEADGLERLLNPVPPICCTGIAAVNTASALTRVLATRPKPRVVIQFGIGGAYEFSGVEIGDVVIAETEVYADVGVQMANGDWRGVDAIGIPLYESPKPFVTEPTTKFYNRFHCDTWLVLNASKICGDVRNGTFLTVSTCTGTNERAEELFNQYGSICENMEGAAAAHVCEMFDVPFLEVRGISNLVEHRDKSKWEIPQAIHVVHRAVAQLVRRFDEWFRWPEGLDP